MNRKTAEHLDLSIHTKTRKNLPRELAISGLFDALIAAGAFIQVTIPVQPYPMHVTMQWFFVLLAGLLLEPKLAAGSVGLLEHPEALARAAAEFAADTEGRPYVCPIPDTVPVPEG